MCMWWHLLSPIVSVIIIVFGVFYSFLTLVLLDCFNCIFHHLKLKLLTQFPSSNDEKYLHFLENIHLLNCVTFLTDHLPKAMLSIFSDILFDLKHVWTRIYTGLAGQGLKYGVNLEGRTKYDSLNPTLPARGWVSLSHYLITANQSVLISPITLPSLNLKL